jgi:methionine aminopeptidase
MGIALRVADLIHIDFGAVFGGNRTDIARTASVNALSVVDPALTSRRRPDVGHCVALQALLPCAWVDSNHRPSD